VLPRRNAVRACFGTTARITGSSRTISADAGTTFHGPNHSIDRKYYLSSLRYASTKSIRASSLDARWQAIAQRIVHDLESSSSSGILPSTMHELQETIKYYAKIKGDLKACWDLLNALEEYVSGHRDIMDGTTSTMVVPNTILVPLFRRWQRQIKAAGRPIPEKGYLSPADLARALSKYQKAGMLEPTPTTMRTTIKEQAMMAATQYLPAMILDVAAHLATTSSSSTSNRKTGSHHRHRHKDHTATNAAKFCQDFLQEWIQDSTKEPPDVVVVGTVLQAIVVTSSNPQQAEAFWNQITKQLPHLQPNKFWYAIMTSAWAKQGNVPMAMKWLDKMRNEGGYEPDLATWNSLLVAHAKQPGAVGTTSTPGHKDSLVSAEQAETLLYKMIELYEQGHIQQPPDVVSYSTVLDAWAQRAWKNPRAAQRAQLLLERMEQEHADGKVVPVPNIVSYNTVIQAHGRAGNPELAEQVFLALLEKEHVRPDEITVTAVLSAWSQVGTWEAAERAERILKEILPRMGLQPDVFAYGACLACWAKITNQNQAMQRAQALFDEMMASSSPHLRPDVVAYTNLMNVYGLYDQPEKAESLLHDMLLSSRGDCYHHEDLERCTPNVHTFSVLISAWARSSRSDGVKRAEEWLYRMHDEFGVRPNVVSYTTVLHAWSKRARQDPEAPDRAHEILRTISNMANSRSFAAVIQAYAQQGRAEEAEALLQQMLDARSGSPLPDAYVFSAVLHAWSKTACCPPLEAARRAEKLLMLMHELHRSRKLQEPPNVVCFSNVLKCWSRIPGIEGAERAQAILETMMSYGVEPNIFSLNIVMNAWASHASTSSHAVAKVSSLFEIAKKTQQPDVYTYRAMYKAISTSSLPDKAVLASRIMEEMSDLGSASRSD
jgi:pentatricopeptide repeat protein